MWNDIAGQTLDGAAGSYAAAAPVIQAGRETYLVVGTACHRIRTRRR